MSEEAFEDDRKPAAVDEKEPRDLEKGEGCGGVKLSPSASTQSKCAHQSLSSHHKQSHKHSQKHADKHSHHHHHYHKSTREAHRKNDKIAADDLLGAPSTDNNQATVASLPPKTAGHCNQEAENDDLFSNFVAMYTDPNEGLYEKGMTLFSVAFVFWCEVCFTIYLVLLHSDMCVDSLKMDEHVPGSSKGHASKETTGRKNVENQLTGHDEQASEESPREEDMEAAAKLVVQADKLEWFERALNQENASEMQSRQQANLEQEACIDESGPPASEVATDNPITAAANRTFPLPQEPRRPGAYAVEGPDPDMALRACQTESQSNAI
jgi:hypothetical protein